MMIDEDYKTIESQSDESPRDRSVLHKQMDISDPYILPLFNVYRYVNNCASRGMQIYAAQPRIMISSTRKLINIKCDFFWLRVIVYIFAYRSKIVLFPNLFYGTEEI